MQELWRKCMYCHIRYGCVTLDDKDQVEHGNAVFQECNDCDNAPMGCPASDCADSHGICPECHQERYGGADL